MLFIERRQRKGLHLDGGSRKACGCWGLLGEAECRQNSQGKSKHKVHQGSLQGLSMMLADG